MRKKKSTYRYDKLIELYNSGITDVDEISKKINASKNTVYVYISRAKKEGRIIKAKKSQKELPKKRPQKTKYKIVIELYNSGITDADVISKKAKLNKNTVYSYISKAKNEGKIVKIEKQKRKSKYDKVVELYNSGTTDVKEIARRFKTTPKTIYSYISKAYKEGKIVKVKKSKIKKEKNQKKQSKYAQLIELYNSGITDVVKLVKSLKTTQSTVYSYIYKAEKEGKIVRILPKKERRMNNANEKVVKKVHQEVSKKESVNIPNVNISKEIQEKVEIKIVAQYPYEIAKTLNIQPKILYDYLESMPDQKKKDLKREILKRNIIWIGIKDLKIKQRKKGKDISVAEALEQIIPTLSEYDKIKLVRFYYWIGQEKLALKTAKQFFYSDDISEKGKKRFEKECKMIEKEMLINMIRAKREVAHSELCREFKITNSFLIEILGREQVKDEEVR